MTEKCKVRIEFTQSICIWQALRGISINRKFLFL